MSENQGNYLLRDISEQDKIHGGSNKKSMKLGKLPATGYPATARKWAKYSKSI